jgi:hypothetical protein
MSPQGVLTVEESTEGIAKVILDPKLESGEFYSVRIRASVVLTGQWNGSKYPW